MNSSTKEIIFGSSQYQAELVVRNEVLRKPLGLDINQDDRSHEPECTHFGIFVDNQLAGVCYVKWLDEATAQIKQVAVLEDYQGKQLGRQLIQAAEQCCRSAGKSRIKIEARQKAWSFYEKLGYFFEGTPEFTQVGGVHKIMWKEL